MVGEWVVAVVDGTERDAFEEAVLGVCMCVSVVLRLPEREPLVFLKEGSSSDFT